MNARLVGAILLLWPGVASAQQSGDATNCVVLAVNNDGSRDFVNQCGSTVSVFWCEVGKECDTGIGSSTWNIGSGRRFPPMRKGEIRWAACFGRDNGGFRKGSSGTRFACDLDDASQHIQSAQAEKERQRIADEGEEERERQRQSYDDANSASEGRIRGYERDRETADERRGTFSSAAARNRALIEAREQRSGGYERGASVDDAMGGVLRDTLSMLRGQLSGSGSTAGDDGRPASQSLLPGFMPSSDTLSGAATLFDYQSWPGTTLLSAGAEYVGHLEKLNSNVEPYWELYQTLRNGDVTGTARAGSGIAAYATLPSYAAFFVVPAINATSAIMHNAIGQFDTIMQNFDAQTDIVASSNQPLPQGGPAPLNPNFADRSLIESYCTGCRWDEEKKRWLIGGEGGLVRLGGSEGLRVGWKDVEVALPSRDGK